MVLPTPSRCQFRGHHCESGRAPSQRILLLAARRHTLGGSPSLWPHNGRNLAAFTQISSELLLCRFPAQDTNNPVISISE